MIQPEFHYFREGKLSSAASDLVQFDADSIRQIVSAQRRTEPDVWLIDPVQYEQNGRVLRDSDSPRMLAYSRKDQVLYATDGCNSCSRPVPANLQLLGQPGLKAFAEENDLRLELLERIVSLLSARS